MFTGIAGLHDDRFRVGKFAFFCDKTRDKF